MQFLKLFDLLPKTDCLKCGHDTCLTFARKFAQGRTALQTCPHISEESANAVVHIILAEQRLVSFLRKALTEALHGEIKSAFFQLREVCTKFPCRVLGFLFLVFPLSISVTVAALRFFAR
jgi:Na+-translocating ferredoxin:NAD+ oxidoreductase RNF subunit RnfB